MVRIVRKEQDSVIGGVTIDCANTVTLYADGFSITLNYNDTVISVDDETKLNGKGMFVNNLEVHYISSEVINKIKLLIEAEVASARLRSDN